jgi:hypothetical protein
MVINYPQHYYPKSGTKLTRPKAGEEVTRWVGGEGRRGGVINCASCESCLLSLYVVRV